MAWTSVRPPVDIGDATLPGMLEEIAAAHGDHVALVDGPTGRSVTYAELTSRVERISAWLAHSGVSSGDIVAIWAPNTPPWAACAFAAMRLGAAVTGINPAYTRHEAAPQLRLAHTVVAAPERVPDVVAEGARHVLALGEGTQHGSIHDALGCREASVAAATDPSAIALLPFSSGTAGLPKGVRLDHRNLVAGVRIVNATMGFGPGDVTLTVAPFFHVLGGVVGMFCPLTAGGTVVTMPRFEPTMLLNLIGRHAVSVMAVPPPLARFLVEHPAVATRDLSSLRLIAVGGAPLTEALQSALQERLPGCVVSQGYGLTETTASVCVPDRDRPTRAGSVGRLAPSTELRVIDLVTGRDLRTDEAGEIWVRGPQVMRGYLDDATVTDGAVTVDGWLRTGDLGRVDAAGNVYIEDRIKELVKVDGFQVAPAEVETALAAHPDVEDAAVIGRPDARHGEVPVAFIVGDATAAQLVDWLEGRLAPYKRPVEFISVDEIPRTPSGKILRRLLRDRVRL